jgi:hypothetical protein
LGVSLKDRTIRRGGRAGNLMSVDTDYGLPGVPKGRRIRV